ncbi:GNAT family N-acetyltransferase [Azospirillum picis]|uniref:RimJ/RimL family protein N-acetyltransferase n=1 Tax=Azospirillum picis TaxID=488438 RepID=A0ABU0MJG0_9PROT|nr:GNAT family N-acetyltransferase [Azospirillum picis]MBP2299474.1 RimJ/RimL family protein N-acetyltransferase [Azospirillum picis]MDQ0533399.1 RimJ/RimL family protein N-acetyltransferase [Azospirillum picis]
MPVIRKIMPTELRLYREHLLRLDRVDRYARFTGTLSDDAVKRHCAAIDWGRTVLLGVFADGTLRGAVELCGDRILWPNQAEIGVSIEKAMQGQGVGSTLVRRILTVARNRGIRQVHMMCLADNVRMRALARRFGGRLALDGGEITAQFELPPPNQFSIALETLEDGNGAFNSILSGVSGLAMARHQPLAA